MDGGTAVGASARAVVPLRWTWELETPRSGRLVVDWPVACRVTALRDSRTGRSLPVEKAEMDGAVEPVIASLSSWTARGVVRPIVEGVLAEGRPFRAMIEGDLPGCRGVLRRFRSAMDAFLRRSEGEASVFETVLGELRDEFRRRLRARGINPSDEETLREVMADLRISTRRRIRSLPVHRTFSRLSAWLPLCFEEGAAPLDAVLEAWRDLLVLARCDQTTLALLGEACFEVDGVLEAVAPEWRVAHEQLPRVEARLRAERDRTTLPLSRSVLERSDADSALRATGREWKSAMDGLAFIKEAAPELEGAFSFDPKATPDHLEAVVDGAPPGARRLEVGGVVFNLTPFLVLRLHLVGTRTGRRVELLLRNSPAAYLGYQGGERRLGARRQLLGRSLPATWSRRNLSAWSSRWSRSIRRRGVSSTSPGSGCAGRPDEDRGILAREVPWNRSSRRGSSASASSCSASPAASSEAFAGSGPRDGRGGRRAGRELLRRTGELLAFIGPNGAGKSTTIKMLTGILHPSSGSARVLGMVPWEDRRRLAFRIGSVFGQKSQLWMHLPPSDSFRLLARIYEFPTNATGVAWESSSSSSSWRSSWRRPCASSPSASACAARSPPLWSTSRRSSSWTSRPSGWT